jgi:beta-phosphoglucomutase-like phosphatase (HAD superfamily)
MNVSIDTLQAIIWDMDGVLVDTEELHYQTWLELHQRFGNDNLPPSRIKFKAIFGMCNSDVIPQFFDLSQATPAFIAELGIAKEVLFRKRLPGKVTPLPGVWRWLEYWSKTDVKQAVGSSAPALNIDAILTELKAHRFFETIVSGEADSITHSKPAPDIFLEAARQLGVAPANCLVVEDAVVGVQAAKSAGMRCVAVTTTNSPSDLAAADLVVATLTDLPPEQLSVWWKTVTMTKK